MRREATTGMLIVLIISIAPFAAAMANPGPYLWVTQHPQLTISPTNFSNGSIVEVQNDSSPVNFNIKIDTGHIDFWRGSQINLTVECFVDGNQRDTRTLHGNGSTVFYEFKTTYLKEGNHTIEVTVNTDHYSIEPYSTLVGHGSGSSGRLFFTIEKPIATFTPEPSGSFFSIADGVYNPDILAITIVSFVVVVLISLVYFKRTRT